MESPDSTDAAAYEQNLALLSRLMPAMPPDARSRAALSVARSKANIAEAVAREGFDLHAAAAREAAPSRTVAPSVAPPTAPVAASTSDLGNLMRASDAMQRGVLRGTVTRETADVVKRAASDAIDAAAKELQARNPSMTYYQCVESVTRGRS